MRAAEQKAVELKRDAASIQDSISAEDIGKLPDTTIADSLQRITGVQINRDGGEGTSVNIRGLPQVGTLLNGEAFLTTGSIVSVQPDFGDIPSQLFSGADVNKSPSASLLNAGITGTINLRTRRPFDLQQGWTLAGAASALHGSQTDKYQPEIDTLIGFHAERWGVVASAAYSDVTLEHSFDGMGQYSGELVGETSDNTTWPKGFLNAYNGAPLPAGVTLLNPSECVQDGNRMIVRPGRLALSGNGCDVDVNGDGKANGAYYNTADYAAIDEQLGRSAWVSMCRCRASWAMASSSCQTSSTPTRRATTARPATSSIPPPGTARPSCRSPSAIPASRSTTVTTASPTAAARRSTTSTSLKRQFYIGDIETYSDDNVNKSKSRNFNLELSYDKGGKLPVRCAAIYANASALHMESYLQYAISDGSIWKNEPSMPSPPVPPATYAYVTPNGPREFNPYGIAPNTIPATITSSVITGARPAALGAQYARNPNAYALKTVTSEGDYDRSSTMKALRADGHYKFGNHNVTLDFGLRQEQPQRRQRELRAGRAGLRGTGLLQPGHRPGHWRGRPVDAHPGAGRLLPALQGRRHRARRPGHSRRLQGR